MLCQRVQNNEVLTLQGGQVLQPRVQRFGLFRVSSYFLQAQIQASSVRHWSVLTSLTLRSCMGKEEADALARAHLPALQKLKVFELYPESAAGIARCSWPQLQNLEVHFLTVPQARRYFFFSF